EAALIAECWPCWTIALRRRATARFSSTACRITRSQPSAKTSKGSSAMFEISVDQTFAAAHALRNYKGKCENVHGHNFRVQVTIEGERLDDTGLLVDFIDVKNQMRAVIERLDHQFLN